MVNIYEYYCEFCGYKSCYMTDSNEEEVGCPLCHKYNKLGDNLTFYEEGSV